MKDAEEPPPLAFELVGVPLLDNRGNPVSGAALKLTEYTAPAPAATSGMGKNQQKVLAVLEQLHQEIAARLANQGRQDQSVLIEHEHWRQHCETEGIARNRYKEARDALLKRNAIRLDGPHVFLLMTAVRNVRTPLGESDVSDGQQRVPFGQTGHDSDALRTETGQAATLPTTPSKHPAKH